MKENFLTLGAVKNNTDSSVLDGATLKNMLLGAVASLRERVELVNSHNVFPVPDADTGDNMYRTLLSGVERIRDDKENNVSRMAESVSLGMLYSARGNSGVILSELFSGFAEGLSGGSCVTGEEIIEALERGVRSGYSAVAEAKEGTILTVAREAVEYARERYERGDARILFNLVKMAKKSYERTPLLMRELKEAGVADSGGEGLVYILEGALFSLLGRSRYQFILDGNNYMSDAERTHKTEGNDGDLWYGYCTEMLIDLKDGTNDKSEPRTVKEILLRMGDSVAVMRRGTLLRVHVHTDYPERVLQSMHELGEFINIKIENMTVGHSNAGFNV